jgi:hypothetical protein
MKKWRPLLARHFSSRRARLRVKEILLALALTAAAAAVIAATLWERVPVPPAQTPFNTARKQAAG